MLNGPHLPVLPGMRGDMGTLWLEGWEHPEGFWGAWRSLTAPPAPGFCRCSPCSQHPSCSKTWLQTAPQGGWSAGTPTAPTPSPPVHGTPTFSPGNAHAMGSQRPQGSGSHPAPQAHGIGTHPTPGGEKAPMGPPEGLGGQHKATPPLGIAPAQGRMGLCPLAASSSLPTHHWDLRHPWVQGSSVGWGCRMEGLGVLLVLGAAVLLGEHPSWLSSGSQRPCPHRRVVPPCPPPWVLRWSWAAGEALSTVGGAALSLSLCPEQWAHLCVAYGGL